jgi:tetratricopeptide (TPR) repeat protein
MYFGDQLRNLGHHQPALAIYRRWAGLFPNEPAAYSRIASVHYKLRDWDNAETACLQAARLSPNEAFFHAQLAEIYERTNRIEAAREMASRAIELNGDLPLANLTLAKIERRQQEYEASKARLTRLVESGLLSQRLLASAHLELGHVHEALGEFDEAFDCFQAGKSVCAKSPEARSMSRETYPALLDGYRQQITSENVGKWSDVALDNRSPPVFLVGFPRSGTTLLEQILGRHPQMIAVDEPPFVSKMLTAAQVLAGPSLSYPKVLNLLNENQIRGLAIEYWDAVKERFDAKDLSGKTLLDKLPLNLNHLPLIRRVFPNAHVIVAVRDPRDCVLSFFFQQFRPNIAMIHSHTLDDSARLYEKVMGLWLHYRACLGLNWIESRYEDLVDDAATSVRRLFEFLGIGWDSSVLSIPEEQQGKVSSTPSYQMVIRPVYKSAVGRWRLYSKHLEGVMPRLQPFVDEFRYD